MSYYHLQMFYEVFINQPLNPERRTQNLGTIFIKDDSYQ